LCSIEVNSLCCTVAPHRHSFVAPHRHSFVAPHRHSFVAPHRLSFVAPHRHSFVARRDKKLKQSLAELKLGGHINPLLPPTFSLSLLYFSPISFPPLLSPSSFSFVSLSLPFRSLPSSLVELESLGSAVSRQCIFTILLPKIRPVTTYLVILHVC